MLLTFPFKDKGAAMDPDEHAHRLDSAGHEGESLSGPFIQ